MKLVTQVKLVPDAVQAPAFERTLPAVNEAANWVSAVSSLPNTSRFVSCGLANGCEEIAGPLRGPTAKDALSPERERPGFLARTG
ncbi:hypothetical protein ACFZA4_25420 [Streptomyces antimycoticus]|uniref:hypothetical protein n=1 Tax=Streptomyces antimycoticus TaxID=68175 RepID=UPI0036DFF971